MNARKSTILAVLLLLLYYTSYTQQEQRGDSTSQLQERCHITVTSNLENAIVILDGSHVGTTPCSIDTLVQGMHHIKVLHPDIQSWLTEMFDDSLELKLGETKSLSYNFHARFTLTSEPFDATVMLGDSLIGKTPLVMQIPMGSSALRIAKPGFETTSPLLTDMSQSFYSVPLKNVTGDDENNDMFKNTTANNQQRWPLYATGAGTVLSGAIAAYLKVRADNTFADYRATGNPALLSKTNRLDTGAAIALIVTQIQLGLFTYFILSE